MDRLQKNLILLIIVFVLISLSFAGGVSAKPLTFRTDAHGLNTSRNWAGYVASAGKFTFVTGSWVVPLVKNSSDFKTDAAWIGIGGVNSSDLIQAGTQAVTGIGGTVSYQAWYEMLPGYSHQIPIIINPRDSVYVAITKKNENRWEIVFSNLSTGENYNLNVKYMSTLSSVEWIEEMPTVASLLDNSFAPLDNFGKIGFKAGYAKKNGQMLDIAEAGAQRVVMVNSSGKVLARPSALGNDGASFQVSRSRVLFTRIKEIKGFVSGILHHRRR